MQPGGTSQQLLGVDAVREFNVLRDSYGAEYGKRPGAQVLIVTQSGTNQLHGSLYEFLRNNALDARNFFDGSSAPGFQRNQFGGSLGGPFKKNKTFAVRQFRGIPPAPAPDRRGPGARQQCAQRISALQAGDARRRVLAPPPDWSFVGVSPLINAWPAPTPGAPDFGGISEAFNNPLQTIRDDFGTVRLDHIFSAKDTLNAVYTIDDSADFTPTSTNAYSTDVGEPARAGGQHGGDARLFAVTAEHRAHRLLARRLLLHRRTDTRHSGRRVCRASCTGTRWARSWSAAARRRIRPRS